MEVEVRVNKPEVEEPGLTGRDNKQAEAGIGYFGEWEFEVKQR